MILGRLIGIIILTIILGILNFLNIKYPNMDWLNLEVLFAYVAIWGIFISWGQVRLLQSMLNNEDELKSSNRLLKGINNVLSRRRPPKQTSRKEDK